MCWISSVVWCCLLVVVRCLLSVVCCLVFAGCCALFVGCWLLVAVCLLDCCLLFAMVCCWFGVFADCWLLSDDWRLLFVLFGVSCSLSSTGSVYVVCVWFLCVGYRVLFVSLLLIVCWIVGLLVVWCLLYVV